MTFEYEVKGGDFDNAGNASSSVKKLLKELNVSPAIIKRTVVALYEGEVNVAAHAWEGNIIVDLNAERILIRIQDQGPGIEDIEMAMKEGFSTASQAVREMGFGAGMGLPNIQRNTDFFEIKSKPGQGTTLEMMNYLKERNG